MTILPFADAFAKTIGAALGHAGAGLDTFHREAAL